MYGLSMFPSYDDMKVMRIVSGRGCVYVESQFFRRWWFRVSGRYKTNIEVYNWVRRQKDVELLRK